MILLYVLLTVYILAINFYSFLLLKRQQELDEFERAGDGKLLLSGLLGGAVTVYVCMFLYRYKLNNIVLMVVLPVLAALNIYLFFLAYRFGFGLRVIL